MIATATTSRQHTLFCDRESLQEWKVTMRTSNMRTGIFRSTIGKIAMALVCASMIGGTFIAPAFGGDNDRYEGNHKQGRYKHSRPVHHPPPPSLLPGACLCATTGCLCPGSVSVAGHQHCFPYPHLHSIRNPSCREGEGRISMGWFRGGLLSGVPCNHGSRNVDHRTLCSRYIRCRAHSLCHPNPPNRGRSNRTAVAS